MRPHPWVLVAVLATPALLAGCTEDARDPRDILTDTEVVGESLYSYSDPKWTEGEIPPSRIRANFTVPFHYDSAGVSFSGSFFEPEGSGMWLNVTGRDQSIFTKLHAAEGETDDHGRIGTFWQFDRVQPIRPQRYDIVLAGEGNISHVQFDIHGIPGGTTSINKTFELEDGDGDVSLEVFLLGWGDTPAVHLVGPGGKATQVDLDGPQGQASLTVPAKTGTWRLDVDTTDWGGRFTVRVRQV